jgi:hypothetical protein
MTGLFFPSPSRIFYSNEFLFKTEVELENNFALRKCEVGSRRMSNGQYSVRIKAQL